MIGRGRPSPVLDDPSRRRVLERMLGAGCTNREIARHFGIRPQTVSGWRRLLNAPARSFRTDANLSAARRMRRHGATNVAIARAIGCSESTIRLWAREGFVAARERHNWHDTPDDVTPDRRCDCGGIVRAGVPHRCPYAEAAA